MTASSAAAPRRRGRPPKSSPPAPAPADRLLAAAGQACAELGFESVTLEAIGRRAGMTAAGIYNHFGGKAELLYAAGVYALEGMGDVLGGDGTEPRTVRDVAAAYLRPEMATARRLFVELHLAGARHPELAHHLARWHEQWARMFAGVAPPEDDDPAATVKALFLVLLGLCHLDELSDMPSSPSALSARVDGLIDSLF